MGAQKTDEYELMDAQKTRGEYDLTGARKTRGEYELMDALKLVSCVQSEKVQHPCVQNSSCIGVWKN